MTPQEVAPETPRFSAWKALKATVVFIFVGIPALLFIPSMLLYDGQVGFIPSVELRTTAELFSWCSMLTLLALVIRDSQRKKLNWSLPTTQLKLTLSTLLFITVWYWGLMGFIFTSSPVIFALHAYFSKPGSVVENVIRTDKVRRPCHSMALLKNSSWLWKRRLCNISIEDQMALHGGGQVQLTGTISRFGVKVAKYSVTQANRPRLKLQIPPGLGTLSDPATGARNTPKSQND
jgi:amino acid transporter